MAEQTNPREITDAFIHPSGETRQTPALETVVLPLTWHVQTDYEERGVFPEFRTQKAQFKHGMKTFYFCSLENSESILADATARRDTAKGGMKIAYKSHIKELTLAMQEARERRGTFEAALPICRHKSSHSEDWRGTKQQLTALGVCLDGPWPKEPGGKNWTHVRDKRGLSVSLSLDCSIWGFYRAYMELPWKERILEQVQPREPEIPRQYGHLRLVWSATA